MKLLTFILIIISLNCTAQLASGTYTTTGTVSNTTTTEPTVVNTYLDTVTPFVYKTETFTKVSDGNYITIVNGSLVTLNETLINETIRILNARKEKGENVENELIVNSMRLGKLKILNK